MALLETTTAEGALRGMVLARAPHELSDQEVAYLQDAIINQPGFVNRRGAITGTTAITAANVDSARPLAVCSVYDPAGVQKIGVIYSKDTGTAYEIWMAVFNTSLAFTQKHYLFGPMSGSGIYPGRTVMVQTTPSIDGSVIISLRQTYGRNLSAGPTAQSAILKWYGGCPTNSLTNAGLNATLTSTEGSPSVTGAAGEIAKVSFPGIVISGIGVVNIVTSATQVELMYPSPFTQAAVATALSVAEGLGVARARGKVSCAAGVLVSVTGYGTKFTEISDRPLISGGSMLFDSSSMQMLARSGVGGASALTDTTTTVPAAVPRSAALKSYLMWACNPSQNTGPFCRFGLSYSGTQLTPRSAKGSWWTTYKGLMLSFNAVVSSIVAGDTGDTNTTGRGYVHGPRFPEIMDHSTADGDWFDVTSGKPGDIDGMAVGSCSEAVVLCKTQESFALIGDDPDNFALTKIADDGALSFESITSWKNSAIWLGKNGIWKYDGPGTAAVNIVENTLGNRWKELVAGYSATSYAFQDSDNYPSNQARCFVYRDHLFVNVAAMNSVHSIYTDGTPHAQSTMQLMIYLPTMAVTYLTNFNFQCFLQIGQAGYVIFPQLGSTTHHWFPLDNIWTQGLATVDVILTANSYNSGSVPTSVGPWFHMESRKFFAGDGLRRKVWKQLALEYKMTNTRRIFLDTVAGLNTLGLRATTPYVGNGNFLAFKNKFNARDQYMSFRLYEDINNRPNTLILGAWQWAYKLARRGQV